MATKAKNMNFTNSLAMNFGVVFVVFAITLFVVNSFLDVTMTAAKTSTMILGIIFMIFGVLSVFISYPRR
jgi:uncharacterized membrane protein